MIRASPEANGRCHRATTGSVLPRRRQGDSKQNKYAKCVHFADHFDGHCGGRYYTTCIARWRRFVAFIKATKRRYPASTHSNRHQSDKPTPILGVYFIVKSLKKSSICPINNRGVTHQTDEKHLNNMSEYFVGVVNVAFYLYNNRFVLHIINHYLHKYL